MNSEELLESIRSLVQAKHELDSVRTTLLANFGSQASAKDYGFTVLEADTVQQALLKVVEHWPKEQVEVPTVIGRRAIIRETKSMVLQGIAGRECIIRDRVSDMVKAQVDGKAELHILPLEELTLQ